MNRLIENTVFSGFVIACRLATCPTRISPSFVNPTTEGVSRLPSWFAITVGLPPSTTATTELVVPRSMPITFAMSILPSPWSHCDGADRPLRRHTTSNDANDSDDIDLDRLGLHFFRLREPDLEYSVAVGRLHLLGLHRHRKLDAALELSIGALDVVGALVPDVAADLALTLDRQQVARDRHGHIFLAHARKLEIQNQVVAGLVHVENRRPHRYARSSRGGRGPPEEALEEAVDLSLNVGHVAERVTALHGHERTPTLNRHCSRPPWLSAGLLLAGITMSTSYVYHLC